MTLQMIPQHTLGPGEKCPHIEADPDRGCYWCCDACNHDTHTCPGCGTPLSHAGNELKDVIRAEDGTTVKYIYEPHEGCTD